MKNKKLERKKRSKQRDQERRNNRRTKETNGFPMHALLSEEEVNKLRKAVR